MEGINYAVYNGPAEPSTPSSRPPQPTSGCPFLQEPHMAFAGPHNPHAASHYTPPRSMYDPVHSQSGAWPSPTAPPYYPAWSALPPLPTGRPDFADHPNFVPGNPTVAGHRRPYSMMAGPYGSFGREWAPNHPAFTPRSGLGYPPQPASFNLPNPLPPPSQQGREDTPQMTSMSSADPSATSWTDTSSAAPTAAPSTRSQPLSQDGGSLSSTDDDDSSEGSSAMRQPSPPIVNGSSTAAEASVSNDAPSTPEPVPQSSSSHHMSGFPLAGFTHPPPTGPSHDRRPTMGFRGPRGGRLTMPRLSGNVSDEGLRASMEAHQRFVEDFYTQDVAGGSRGAELTEDRIRQHQLARGGLTARQIASPSAIASLESVDIDTLEENERTCIICYNDFGIATPEGINEAPLRLPKCKHIFGDHCIKKWFEESDSCPYCRHKLPSVQVYRTNKNSTAHTVVTQHELLTRLASTSRREDREEAALAEARLHHNGRRSPPDDLAGRRRLRARHSSFRGSPPAQPTGTARPISLPGAQSSSVTSPTQHSPVRDRHGPYQTHSAQWLPPFHGQFGNQRRFNTFNRMNPPAGHMENFSAERSGMPATPAGYPTQPYSLFDEMRRQGPMPPIMMASPMPGGAGVSSALPPVIPPLNASQQQPNSNPMVQGPLARHGQPSFPPPAQYPTSMIRGTPMPEMEFGPGNDVPIPQPPPGSWQM